MVEHSIIIPTMDNIVFLSQCLAKLTDSVEPSSVEIIVIEQGPSDVSKQVLQHYCEAAHISEYQWIDQRGQRGFAHSCNAGMKASKGQYILLLNDDVVVPKGFLNGLTTCMNNFTKIYKLGPVGLVGPISNFVGGRQQIPMSNVPNPVATIDAIQLQVVAKTTTEYKGQKPWIFSGFLSGFCLMFKRQVYTEVGDLDEESFENSFEDNDWVTRAMLKGWIPVVAGDVFVYHYGSQVIKRPGFEKGLKLDYRHAYYKKWEDPNPKKLGVIYRVKISDEYIRDIFIKSLQKTVTFADGIFILDDNSPIKLGPYLRENYPEIWSKITKYEKFARGFDERRDRNQLLVWAEEAGMDWIFSIDADEIPEAKVNRDLVQRLMHPVNPQIMAYNVHWYTFWDNEERWRFDGVWGKMTGARFCRVIKGNRIVLGSDSTLHNGNVPNFPGECVRDAGIRMKHYGYVQLKQREIKREWYEKIDTDKKPELIGHSDYAHLVDDSKLTTYKWQEKNNLTIYVPTKKAGNDFDEWIELLWAFTDEIVVGDDGLSEEDKIKIKRWGCKIVPTTMGENFGEGRNKILRECTGDYILQLDLDEKLDSLAGIRRLMDVPTYDGWTFQILNHQKTGGSITTETTRLFKNDGHVTYWGYLHETIDDYGKKNKWKLCRAPVKINHYGYVSQDKTTMFNKMQRYMTINLKQMKDFPEDARAYYNLAMHMLEDDLIDDALKLLELAVNLRKDHMISAAEMGKLFITKSHGWFEYALKILEGTDHPNIPQLQQAVQHLSKMKPSNLVAARGHCIGYFSANKKETEWLYAHIEKMRTARGLV